MTTSRPPLSPPSVLRSSLHLLVLWSFAVAEPVYEVLRRNREFFVAHRTGPLDLLAFVALLSLLLPGVVAIILALGRRFWPRAGEIAWLVVATVLIAAVASQVLAQNARFSWPVHFLIAVALGAAAAVAYARFAAMRTFLTVLVPAVLIFPAILVFHPTMAPFVHPGQDATAAAMVTFDGTPPPIVVAVFDQLPLTSLMTSDGQLDTARLPGFASLAADATWYRNASTAAELTGWAIPPILTGLRPQRGQLPIARDYPHNLFTMLAGTYHMEVEEPITDLCPERLCPSDDQSRADRLVASTIDASVVYLYAVLPADLRKDLPPLTQDWKNFLQDQQWQRRWVTERDQDRRAGPREFIDSIQRTDPQPTLYYLHALLPHEPYIYLRSGQQFTEDTDMPGLQSTGRWVDDQWPVIQAYRRHLIQVGYVDALVGQMVERLKHEGLWDKALVVVTADHGVSFRPGHPFKGLDGHTLPDIMTVPLFIKPPGQHGGHIDDRNVQSVDVIPTIADVLDVELPWHPDGQSALVEGDRGGTKRIQHTAATRTIDVDIAVLNKLRDEAVRRREQLFGNPTNPDLDPTISVHHELIGRSIADLDTGQTDSAIVVVADAARYAQLDPDAAVLPVMLEGQVLDEEGHATDAQLAVAVNGVIWATTRTYPSTIAPQGEWHAFVAPRHWRAGKNDVGVYLIEEENGQVRLDQGFSLSRRPEALNLASRGAADYWSVEQKGLWPREGSPIPFRWTDGAATIVVPLVNAVPPRSLRLGLHAVRPGGTALTITFNGCTLFDGPVRQAPWYRTFSLTACLPGTLDAPKARIAITSTPYKPRTPQDTRTLGVAVTVLNLFSAAWPPASPGAGTPRAALRVVAPAHPITPGEPATILVENRGTTIWLATEGASEERSPALRLTWQDARTHKALSSVDVPMRRTYYPGDRGFVIVPTAPRTGALPDHAQVVLQPVTPDGQPIPLADPLTIPLTAAAR